MIWRYLANVIWRSCFAALSALGIAYAGPVDPNLYSGLVWRNIGPFRGGRISAVSGVIGQPGVFYVGLPAGGVWKTTGAGTTWVPVMDSVKEASSVGAVEVAPSDPNVIYAGMGDMPTPLTINEGNGVYKSVDAGKTWQHLGLDGTKQIPSILVDPHDPNTLMVAAQGNLHARSEDRGLYRSTDGGKTWTKTLYLDDQTGVQKIAWAYDHPEVMLATTDSHYMAPGTGGGFPSFGGDSGTKLFKSSDEGLTWTELKGGGLPALAGRTCVAIAMNTDAKRMFLVGNFGLYRSDDGGANWRRMDARDSRVSNGQGGYNCGVYVDTKDPDVVYVVNTCLYRSTDGGNTFAGFKGAPGGDDPQQLWIDPTDHLRILLGSDQGATISQDGGLTWSSWYNQPTAQIYHMSVDNSYPYWVYGTQQDSCSIGTRSRGDLGEITPLDWMPVPAYENGSIVADPLNPRVLYGTGGGGVAKITYPGGQAIDVDLGQVRSLNLRTTRSHPLLWSPTNPHELLNGYQCLISTTNGGKHWKMLSPDLTVKELRSKGPKEQGNKDRGTSHDDQGTSHDDRGTSHDDRGTSHEERGTEDEEQRGGGGAAIESVSVSPIDGRTIWVGTSNGLVRLTRDHGGTWTDATVPRLPQGADISAVDASHFDSAEAYVAVDCHNAADYAPYLYRTRDYGKTWDLVVRGLPTGQPGGSFARVIRCDTKKAGLLFAGTESSMYVSFDDGDNWQSLQLNLPTTSYRDLVIKGNDLVAATYGRGFWILDDISPLRQIESRGHGESAYLFQLGEAVRVRRNTNGDTPFPPEVPHALNPPDGAILYYYLGSQPRDEITLDVLDASGALVRHMSSAPELPSHEPPPPIPDFWIEKPRPLPTEIGTNRVNWNLRYDSPPAFGHGYSIGANPGQTPASPEGPLVVPGVYTIRLKVDGKVYEQTVTVRNDPRSQASLADLRGQHDLEMKLYRGARQAWDLYHEVADVRASLSRSGGPGVSAEVTKAESDLDGKMAALQGSGGRGRFFGGGGSGTPSFAGVNSELEGRLGALDSGDSAPNEPMREASGEALANLDKVVKAWQELKSKDLVAFNALLVKNNLKPIAILSGPEQPKGR